MIISKQYKLSKEHRQKISIANKGKKYHRGKKHSKETKRKISESNKGKGNYG